MATRLEIINSALAMLKHDPLDSDVLLVSAAELGDEPGLSSHFDDDAATVAGVYPGVKAGVLAAHPWSWMQRREALAGAPAADGEDAAAWPYPYRFQQPAAVGGIQALYETNREPALPVAAGWMAQGVYVFAPVVRVWADFQAADIAETAIPPLPTHALKVVLASALALPLTEDVDKARFWSQQADMAMRDAKRVDGQSQPAQAIEGFSYLEAHYGGWGYGQDMGRY